LLASDEALQVRPALGVDCPGDVLLEHVGSSFEFLHQPSAARMNG
jgi:hypothetical protein